MRLAASPSELTSRSPEPLVPPKRLIFFLIAAFCRLAESLSHYGQMG